MVKLFRKVIVKIQKTIMKNYRRKTKKTLPHTEKTHTVSLIRWINSTLKVEDVKCNLSEVEEIISKIVGEKVTIKVYNEEGALIRQEIIDREEKKHGHEHGHHHHGHGHHGHDHHEHYA
jgi:hypothetical protein